MQRLPKIDPEMPPPDEPVPPLERSSSEAPSAEDAPATPGTSAVRSTEALTAPDPDDAASSGSAVPRLADGVELLGEYEGSGFKEPRYLARRGDGQMIQLTALLHMVAEEIDGRRDLEQIASRVSERYGRKVSADNVAHLLDNSLRPDGLVIGADGSLPELSKPDPLLALKLKTTLVPEGAVNLIAGLLRPLFWPPVVIAVLAGLIALDVWYFAVHGIGEGLRNLMYQPLTVLLIYGLLIASVAFHELGHATACRYGGARPGKIGFGIYVVWPAFYTDVTDALKLGKGGRVRTDLGGVYFNAIFSLMVGGVYLLTGFEPILVLIVIQHMLVLYQFMPFLRLDGYHVVSDLTGIPDLFGRIKPTLKSMVPGQDASNKVTELKPWARVVVTVWVLTVIPVLLFLFGMMVISAPRVLATGWDSFFVQWDKFRQATGDGKNAQAAVNGIRMAMLVLPMAGMGVTLSRVGKRIAVGAVNITKDRPFARAAVVGIGAVAVGAAIFVLIPNGEYKPIQPGERWTIGDGIEAASAVTTGRPSLPDEVEQQIEGSGFVRDGGSVSTVRSDPDADVDPPDDGVEEDPVEDDAEETQEEPVDEVEPTPDPTEEATPEVSPSG